MPLIAALGTILAYVILLVIIGVPLALWYAYAASIMWGWFVVPVFGLPPLSTIHMWGVMLFLAIIRTRIDTTAKDESKIWEQFGIAVIAPAISLGIGWIVKTYFW